MKVATSLLVAGAFVLLTFAHGQVRTYSKGGWQALQIGEAQRKVERDGVAEEPEPSNPKEREARRAKNTRYNAGGSDLTVELPQGSEMFTEHIWPAVEFIPTEESAVVVVGRVTKVQPYLSSDRSRIYTEITIAVDDLLKRDRENRVTANKTVVIDRLGGEIKLKNGRTVRYGIQIDNLGNLQLGRRYVVFARAINDAKDLELRKSYELLDSMVFTNNSRPSRLISFEDGVPLTWAVEAPFIRAVRERLQPRKSVKGWRGLVPLRATRRDVQRLLGPPTHGGEVYETDEARVQFVYSRGQCEKGWPYGWNVKPDTVESITVKPKDTVFIGDLNLDYKKYLKTPVGHVGEIMYMDKDRGVAIEVEGHTGKVMWFSYIPTTSDAKLACPDSLNRLPAGRRAADSFFKFDVYGDLSPSAEQERLDKVAEYMNALPDSEATIIAYAGIETHLGEAEARATCARNYLIKIHRINPDRIKAIDGGYRESLTVELYVEPKDGDVPLARPSVRPSKVKVNRAKQALVCKSSHSQD